MLRRYYSILLGIAVVTWLLAMAGVTARLLRFETTPGERAVASTAWPEGSRVSPRPHSYNLVLAIHPRCPCTRATIEELTRLLSRCPKNVQIHVLLWQPVSAAPNWKQTDFQERLERIPNLAIVLDEEGVEAERFGARTSGTVVLYGEDGRLLFTGGITAGRGQEGENSASESLRARLSSGVPECCETPVFGCPLSDGSRRSVSTAKP